MLADGNLTKGATASVIVGSLAGAVIVISAAFSLYRRFRVLRMVGMDQTADVAGFFARAKRRSRQGRWSGVREVEGRALPAEADDMNVRAELEGNRVDHGTVTVAPAVPTKVGKQVKPVEADESIVRSELESEWKGNEVVEEKS